MKSSKAPSVHIQEDLERQLLHGLACEWENALWVLPDQKRRLMRPPLFSLRKLKSRLGYWSRHRNEIVISRDFILNYPWDDVRDVLGHEMAHQYTDQVMKSSQQFPHGPDFIEACQQLRLLQQEGENCELVKRVRADIQLAEAHGISILDTDHEHYPELLREIKRPPPVLYVAGDPAQL